jgi:pyrroloquinoline quinone biosynthesis protein D
MVLLAQRRDGAMIEAAVDDGIVGISMETDRCYGLNATAARIWALTDQPRTSVAIADLLAQEFDAPAATILAGVERALRDLESEGLIDLSEIAG